MVAAAADPAAAEAQSDIPPELQRWLVWEACVVKNIARLEALERTTQQAVENIKQRRTSVGFLIAATAEARADRQALKQGTDAALLLRQARERSLLMRHAIEQHIPILLGIFLDRTSDEYAKAGAAQHEAAAILDGLNTYEHGLRELLTAVGMARNVLCANYRHAERRFSDHALAELQRLHRMALGLEAQARQITRLCGGVNQVLAGTVFADERFSAWEPAAWTYCVDVLSQSNITEVQKNVAEILNFINRSLTLDVAMVREESIRLQAHLTERAAGYLRAYWHMLREYAATAWLNPAEQDGMTREIEQWYETSHAGIEPPVDAPTMSPSGTRLVSVQAFTGRTM